MRRVPASTRLARARAVAELVGVSHLLDRRPGALSGGEHQRVALAKALVREPVCFLLDEPLASLDLGLRLRLRSELKSLHAKLGRTTILVTHDQEEAMALGDRLAVMRDGRLQQVASPIEVYRRPANRFVASFIGAPPMNFVEGTLERADAAVRLVADGLVVALPAPIDDLAPPDSSVVLGVRPEVASVRRSGDSELVGADGTGGGGRAARRSKRRGVPARGWTTDGGPGRRRGGTGAGSGRDALRRWCRCVPLRTRSRRDGAPMSAGLGGVALGRAICGDELQATRREWLVADGLGGYACGTVAGEATRKYHGLLVAATDPPGRRVLLLAALDAEVAIDGETIRLATHRWGDGTLDPKGFLHIERFELEDLVPTWAWAVRSALLEQRIWMRHGEPTTFVRYTLRRGGPVRLRLKALTTHRSHHAPDPRPRPGPTVERTADGVRVLAHDGATALHLAAARATGADTSAAWHPADRAFYRNLYLREEAARGYDAIDGVHHAATIEVALALGPVAHDRGVGDTVGVVRGRSGAPSGACSGGGGRPARRGPTRAQRRSDPTGTGARGRSVPGTAARFPVAAPAPP